MTMILCSGKEINHMGIVLFLALLLAAAIAFNIISFVVSCLVIAFKVFVVGVVGYLLWKCFKIFLRAAD